MDTKKSDDGLFFPLRKADLTTLTDYFYVACSNIEEVLSMSGATPGADYSRVDVMKLAWPIVADAWKAQRVTLAFESGSITS